MNLIYRLRDRSAQAESEGDIELFALLAEAADKVSSQANLKSRLYNAERELIFHQSNPQVSRRI